MRQGKRFPRGWMGRAELHPSRRRQLWAGRGGVSIPPPPGKVPPTNSWPQPYQSLMPLLALPGLPTIILVPAGLCCSWTREWGRSARLVRRYPDIPAAGVAEQRRSVCGPPGHPETCPSLGGKG